MLPYFEVHSRECGPAAPVWCIPLGKIQRFVPTSTFESMERAVITLSSGPIYTTRVQAIANGATSRRRQRAVLRRAKSRRDLPRGSIGTSCDLCGFYRFYVNAFIDDKCVVCSPSSVIGVLRRRTDSNSSTREGLHPGARRRRIGASRTIWGC